MPKRFFKQLNPKEQRKIRGGKRGRSFAYKYSDHIYPKLYFVIQEVLAKAKSEGRDLSYEDRQEMVKRAYELECIDKTNPDKAMKFTDRAIDRVLSILMINGDITSRHIKQAEILIAQDTIVESAIEKEDFRTASEANYKRMEVYRMLPKSSEDGIKNPSLFKLTQDAKGNKEALMIGTPDEMISVIRQAMMPKQLERVKKDEA